MSLLDRLRALDACAISDALDQLSLPGVVHGPRPMWPVTGVVAGYVRTIQAGPRPTDGPSAHIAAAAVDASGDDHVLVISNGGRLDVSCWGGILTQAAKRNGIRGVVIDGACRDIAESQQFGFPVFARAAVPTSARGRIVQLSMDEPIAFGDVTVAPGDLVIADVTGLAFIPGARAEEIVEIGERIVAREAAMAIAVAEGKPVNEVMHDTQFANLERHSS
jgi:regulator of RNase E activity RraA